MHEIIYCPICMKPIHSQLSTQIVSRASVPSHVPGAGAEMLTAMMLESERAHQEMLAIAEENCTKHMRAQHAWRYRLWQRFDWEWLMNKRWPWQRTPEMERFDYAKSS